MSESRTRVDYVPLLCIGMAVALGTAALLLIGPTVGCPPCGATGSLVEKTAPTAMEVRACTLCGETGRVRIGTRVRFALAPGDPRGALRGGVRWEEW